MFKRFSESEMITEAREQSKGRKTWQEVLFFLAVFAVTNMVSSLIIEIPMIVDLIKRLLLNENVFQVLKMVKSLFSTEKYMLLSLFATIVTTIGAIIYCTKIEKRSLRTMGFAKKNALREYLMGLMIGAGLFAAALAICWATGSVKISFGHGKSGLILLFLLGYLIQGMSEEVLLRGYFMISLARKNSISWAVILSSLMFALLHIFNSGVTILALVNITLFGVLMAVYMLRRGNIWGVCAIHSAWNFVQGNVFGVQVSGMSVQESVFSADLAKETVWLNGGSFGLEGGFAVTLVLFAAIAVIMLKKQKTT